MRYLVTSAALLLFACAAPQHTATRSPGTQPVNVGIQVAEDGTFFSETPVVTVTDLDRARQAAIHNLRTAAVNYGYESYVISQMNIEETDKVRLVVAGRFFRPGRAPFDAMPVEGLGSGVVMVAGNGFSGTGVPGDAMVGIQPDASITTGSVGTPRVIRAPDLRIN